MASVRSSLIYGRLIFSASQYIDGCHRYGSKQRAQNSCAGEPLTVALPEPAQTTDTAPGEEEPSQEHAPRSHPQTLPEVPKYRLGRGFLFHSQSDRTETNDAQAKSILTVTYWHREQMVTLTENLFPQ